MAGTMSSGGGRARTIAAMADDGNGTSLGHPPHGAAATGPDDYNR